MDIQPQAEWEQGLCSAALAVSLLQSKPEPAAMSGLVAILVEAAAKLVTNVDAVAADLAEAHEAQFRLPCLDDTGFSPVRW